MSKHTFLLSEGYWKATGTFQDDQKIEYSVNGETIIKHLADKWVNKGVMRILAGRSINFTNEYEIEPLLPGAVETQWISHNGALGHLQGTFRIKGDELLSEYRSEQDNYRGSERFTYQSDDQYTVEGVLYKGRKKISSWSVVLQRQHSAASSTQH
ncbi:hypothetical protein [Kaarinaea lacus]